MNQIIASVDIGTNTLLLTIAEVGRELIILEDVHSIARLGQDVDSSGIIQSEAIERAESVLRKYKTICDEYKVNRIKAVGTSCLRDAANRQDVCDRLSSVIGTPIEVITGEEEARLCFIGSVNDDFPATIVDIGGGSTEIISGKNSSIEFRTSIDIGAVRLTERYLSKLPSSTDNLYRAVSDIQAALSGIPQKSVAYPIRAVAGTPTTLAAIVLHLHQFDASVINNYKLQLQDVEKLALKLSVLSLNDITKLPGVHPKRADILLAGVLILRETLKYFDQNHCIVSTKGLRYGVLREMVNPLLI